MAAIDFASPGGLIYGMPPKPPYPQPVPRRPLPPFDPNTVDPDTGAPLPVYKTLNGTIPPLPSMDYMRANLWSVTLPGLPPIQGGANGPAQYRVLSYLFDRYPREWQEFYLQTYCQRGYTHLWRSIPDSLSGSGQSAQGYLDDTKRIMDMGRIPCHFLRSKYYDDPNDLNKYWDLVDSLRKINGIPWAASAWEASLWMSPHQYRAMLDHDATRAPEVRWCVHLQQGYADFGPDGPNHSTVFWESNFQVGVKRLLYQYVTTPMPWTAGMMAARGNDVSVRSGPGGPWGLSQHFDWFSFELCGVCQFNNSPDGDGNVPDEDHGDLKGYEDLCTPGPWPSSGFGGGARYPNGEVI